jgi:hypothetical protein
VTEFKPKDQLSASTSASLEKKKGGQKRRTKREGLNTIPTVLGSRVKLSHPLKSLSRHLKERWPCLVRSPIYNPDYPTFCECLQPHCSYHCPTARCILSRGCTTYSWPAPEVIRTMAGPRRLNHTRIVTLVLRRDIKGILMLVSLFPFPT